MNERSVSGNSDSLFRQYGIRAQREFLSGAITWLKIRHGHPWHAHAHRVSKANRKFLTNTFSHSLYKLSSLTLETSHLKSRCSLLHRTIHTYALLPVKALQFKIYDTTNA